MAYIYTHTTSPKHPRRKTHFSSEALLVFLHQNLENSSTHSKKPICNSNLIDTMHSWPSSNSLPSSGLPVHFPTGPLLLTGLLGLPGHSILGQGSQSWCKRFLAQHLSRAQNLLPYVTQSNASINRELLTSTSAELFLDSSIGKFCQRVNQNRSL